MRDYITLGSSPLDEDCAQVGSTQYEYYERAHAELVEFKRMMETVHPPLEGNPFTRYAIKSFQHDFGAYQELVAYFDDQDEESTEWAYQAENATPTTWDKQAHTTLAKWLK